MKIPFRIIAKSTDKRGNVIANFEDLQFKTIDLDDIEDMLYCEKYIKWDSLNNFRVRDKLNEISNAKNLYSFNEGIISTYRESRSRSYKNTIVIHSKIKLKNGETLYVLENVTDIYSVIGRIYMKERSI